jgi:hypothetical protein
VCVPQVKIGFEGRSQRCIIIQPNEWIIKLADRRNAGGHFLSKPTHGASAEHIEQKQPHRNAPDLGKPMHSGGVFASVSHNPVNAKPV